MAMTKREQYLVIGVAGVAGLLGIQMVVSSIRSGLTAKQQTLDALIAKIEGHDRVNTSGALAGKRLNELKAKSLPANEGLATNQYTTWLREIAAEAGVENIGTEKRFALRGNTFASYQFQLKGDMRLDGLVKLLHSYYQRDCLHRIASLKVTQTPNDPDWVSILLTSEALSLNSANAKQEPSKALSNRVTKSFEEYQDEILGRNPFGPPNQAPKISVATSHDVPRGREWSLDLKATDPDGRHWIDFYLPAELPKGLQFNPESGKISWQPETNGNYELLVQAVDNGFPRKWTEQKLTLKVVDPPAPPPPAVEAPKFDPATQSFVSAILSGRSGAQAWIRSKTDNNTYKVAAGDEIAIGTVKGKVIEVNVDQQFIEIESDGRHWTLGMDDSLQAAYKKSKAD